MNRKGLTMGSLSWAAVLPLLVLALLVCGLPSTLRAQVTATLTGTVEDQSGGVIPGANVTLTNEATKFATSETTNGAGLYAFPSLTPGTYDIKASAKGFKAKQITGIVMNAGDIKTVPALDLTVGAESQTVTVSATAEMIPVENGAHTDVLSASDIDNLALEGRDTTELLKVLPGTVTTSGGLTQTSPTFSDLNITVDEAGVGSGYYTNGSIYRGGTSILVDGARDDRHRRHGFVTCHHLPGDDVGSQHAVLQHERRPGLWPGGHQHNQPLGQRQLSRRRLLQRAQ